MTFHGEAAYASWRLVDRGESAESRQEAEMICELPIAQMTVRRVMWLEDNQAVLVVREHITNTGTLGRIYNIVQHPSIAPPFLDSATIVDSNAQYGFVQGSVMPESVAAADLWPNVMIEGELVDLRRFKMMKLGHGTVMSALSYSTMRKNTDGLPRLVLTPAFFSVICGESKRIRGLLFGGRDRTDG